MAEISKMFREREKSKKNNLDRLRDIGIPPDILGDILNLLTEKNLLIFTEDMEYYPARDPSTITVREIIEAVSGMKLLAPPSAKDPLSRILRKKFEEAGEQVNVSLDGMNLQTLVINGTAQGNRE
jgi:DNA-binding IscR family transcriptional regulator